MNQLNPKFTQLCLKIKLISQHPNWSATKQFNKFWSAHKFQLRWKCAVTAHCEHLCIVFNIFIKHIEIYYFSRSSHMRNFFSTALCLLTNCFYCAHINAGSVSLCMNTFSLSSNNETKRINWIVINQMLLYYSLLFEYATRKVGSFLFSTDKFFYNFLFLFFIFLISKMAHR